LYFFSRIVPLHGNFFAGIGDDTTWNFTTGNLVAFTTVGTTNWTAPSGSLPLRCWWSAAAAGQVASRQARAARAAPVVLPAAWQIPAGAVARAAKATESAAMAVPALSCCPSAARPTPTPGAPGYGGSQMLTTSGGNFTAGQEGYLGFRLNGTNYGSMRVVLTLEPTSTRSALAAR
jgi:hypothetical protein